MTTDPPPLATDDAVESVLDRLRWAKTEGVLRTRKRYLWTYGFGVLALCTVAERAGDDRHLDCAEAVVADVDRVLGRPLG